MQRLIEVAERATERAFAAYEAASQFGGVDDAATAWARFVALDRAANWGRPHSRGIVVRFDARRVRAAGVVVSYAATDDPRTRSAAVGVIKELIARAEARR